MSRAERKRKEKEKGEVIGRGVLAAMPAVAAAFVCDGEERVVGSQQAPGSCPYCGGKVTATDVETQWRLCFLPLCFKSKRRYSCTLCSRRLVLLYPSNNNLS